MESLGKKWVAPSVLGGLPLPRAQSKAAPSPYRVESVDVVRASDQDASWVPSLWSCSRHILLGGDPEEDPELSGVERLSTQSLEIPQSELEDIAREKDVWGSLLDQQPELK